MEAMKRLIILMMIAGAVAGQTGLPADVANKTDFFAEFKAVRDSIVVCQEEYFKKYKRYFQGPKSQEALKELASPTLARFDRSVRPTDQKETWEDFGLKDISTHGTYEVMVYNGPDGWGYIIKVLIAVDGAIYELREAFGPELRHGTKGEFVKFADINRIKLKKKTGRTD